MKLLLIPAGLLLLEGAARLLHCSESLRKNSHEDWYVFSETRHWRRHEGFDGMCFGAPRTFGRFGLFETDCEDLADADTRRILLLGDSCTFGNGVSVSHTYGEVLERRLDGWRVLNLGTPGYSSYQGWRTFEETVTHLRPDVVVIAFNANDRRSAIGEAQRDGAAWFRRSARLNRCLRAARRSALFRCVEDLAARFTSPPVDIELERLRTRVSVQNYGRHLEQLAAGARRHGARPVFLELGDSPRLTRPLREAAQLEAQGRVREAAAELSELAADKKSFFATAAIVQLARLARTGNRAVAEPPGGWRVPVYSSLHGGFQLEPDTVYHAELRRIAARLDVPVVSGAAALAAEPDCYTDFCHFNVRGHERIAELLADCIERCADTTAWKTAP